MGWGGGWMGLERALCGEQDPQVEAGTGARAVEGGVQTGGYGE